MADSISLIKANPLRPAEDYVALRKQGFKAIEKLGSAIWTEYNNSDPGITILEALCYAITDLGYRTGFEVRDLLAPENPTADTWRQIFYTARQILHNNPLTIDDYRKLIIDVKGVRNAWIEPSKDYEVPIWIEYNAWNLSHDCGCDAKDAPAHVCRGRLQASQYSSFNAESAGKTIDEIDAYAASQQTAFDGQIARLQEQQKQLDKESEAYKRLAQRIEAIKAQQAALESIRKATVDEIEAAEAKLDPTKPSILKIVEIEGLYNVLVEYEEDVLDEDRREAVRQRVAHRLFGCRNLCEDFLSIDAIEYVDVGIGASIELEEYADPDDVLAQIFFTIYKYFTPSIPFHTIEQMLAKGYLVDEIFEGPPLEHGFIDSVELERTALFRDIRLSDIINEIADIKGIKGILYLHLPFEGAGGTGWDKSYFSQWVDELRQARKLARIQPSQSQVLFCKEREIITYYAGRPEDRRPERMLKLFKDRKSLERKYKLEGQANDYPVPAGDYRDLEDYYPVTYSLPMCYGVSERAGLPSEPKRHAQAMQLKGYLLFFEQILAGYLTQLNHLRDLFSFDPSVAHTYFGKALADLDQVEALILDYGAFESRLQGILEAPATFASRRNRFLDHMLARFSEDLSDYERISRWLTPNGVDERLIADKINILKDGHYRGIGNNRGRGYDYWQSEVWDTGNVSGTERRVSRLLGFADIRRRKLVPAWLASRPVMYVDPATRLSVQKKNAKGKALNVVVLLDPDDESSVLFTSVEVAEGCCTDELMRIIADRAADPKNFRLKETHRPQGRSYGDSGQAFLFELWDGPDFDCATLLATSGSHASAEERERALHAVKKAIDAIHGNEGLHLVEHILLRPKFDEIYDEAGAPIEIAFPRLCLDACDLGIGIDNGTETPTYRKRIHRIPAKKCYDKMPWVLEYVKPVPPPAIEESLLFQEVPLDGDPVPLKFRRYDALQRRVRALQEFGSERASYEVVSNEADNPADVRYGFILHGDRGAVLAQSRFVFKKKGPVPESSITPVTDYVEWAIGTWIRYFGFELDLYCDADPCDNNEDPYSFRATAALPCWAGRLRDPTFRNLVEKTIETESPAHVHIRVLWLDIGEMQRFEQAYYDWLQATLPGQLPSYEAVNPLIDVLNTLRPCGACDDECG